MCPPRAASRWQEFVRRVYGRLMARSALAGQRYLALAPPDDKDTELVKQWVVAFEQDKSTANSKTRAAESALVTAPNPASKADTSTTTTHQTVTDSAPVRDDQVILGSTSDTEVVMTRSSTTYHRPECPLVLGYQVTPFRRSQIASWAQPCSVCQPADSRP